MLTKDDFCSCSKKLESLSGDFESAHSYEDEVLNRFVLFVLECRDLNDAKEAAAEVAKMRKVDFERWCA